VESLRTPGDAVIMDTEDRWEFAVTSDFIAELVHQFNNSLGATLLLAENLLLLKQHLPERFPMELLVEMTESMTRYSGESSRLPADN
jgi:hypothetical protein